MKQPSVRNVATTIVRTIVSNDIKIDCASDRNLNVLTTILQDIVEPDISSKEATHLLCAAGFKYVGIGVLYNHAVKRGSEFDMGHAFCDYVTDQQRMVSDEDLKALLTHAVHSEFNEPEEYPDGARLLNMVGEIVDYCFKREVYFDKECRTFCELAAIISAGAQISADTATRILNYKGLAALRVTDDVIMQELEVKRRQYTHARSFSDYMNISQASTAQHPEHYGEVLAIINAYLPKED